MLTDISEKHREIEMKPKVTIGTCVRNCAKTISQTIESILCQDFPHECMEIIFVDDGSEDDTLKTIQDYASRIDIKARIFHDSWKGLGTVRNKVVDNAKGDYIVWVDGDMVLSSDFIRKQLEFMESNYNAGIAKGKYELSLGPSLASTLEIYSRGVGTMKNLNKSKLRSVGTGACIYRLKTIKQVGGFDNNIRGYGEDWDAEYRIRSAGWSCHITEAKWRDYERLGLSYGELWQRYVRRGYDIHYFYRKNKGLLKLYRMLPPAGFLSAVLDLPILYKSVRRKLVFLLPFHCMFKTTAWLWGFLKAMLEDASFAFCRT